MEGLHPLFSAQSSTPPADRKGLRAFRQTAVHLGKRLAIDLLTSPHLVKSLSLIVFGLAVAGRNAP